MFKNYKICIVGLGYVGLPLAISLSKYFQVVGYDKDHSRISQLRRGNDMTKETNNKFLKKSKIFFTNTEKNIRACNIYIVTVPTPVDKKNKPELSSIIKATKIVARHIGKNNLIIYESTVYPGCTDEILIPLLQKDTGLKLNKDFYVGYSPERIDPGLSKYKLVNQTKVISGSNKKACEILHYIYGKIIKKKIA